MAAMLKYFDTLCYADEVDYQFLYQTIEKAAKKGKFDLTSPFDWEIDFCDSPTTTPTTTTTNDQKAKTNQQTQKLSVYKSVQQP